MKKTGCDKKSHSTDLMGEDYTLLDHLIATSEILEMVLHNIFKMLDCFIPFMGLHFLCLVVEWCLDERDKIKDLIGKVEEMYILFVC